MEEHTNSLFSLPSNFKGKYEILSNYSKSPIRISPSTGQTQVRSNGYINWQLPVGSTLDLRTFSWHFWCYTNGTADSVVGLPKWTPALIKTLDILVNGVSIQHINLYSHLYNLIQDYKCGYNEKIKNVAINGDPSCITTMAQQGTMVKNCMSFTSGNVDVNTFKNNYVINDWLGFLGSSSPSIINTNLLGVIEIQIQLESSAVLWQNGVVVNAPEFFIENSVAFIDKIEFQDERYMKIQEKIIQGSGGLVIPFKNYTAYLGNDLVNTKTTTLKLTENTVSLDKIMFSYLDANRLQSLNLQLGTPANILTLPANAGALLADYQGGAFLGFTPPSLFNYTNLLANSDNNLLNNSIYFKRNGLGLGAQTGVATTGTVQFEINSQDMTPPLTLTGMYGETLKAFELNDNDKISINPSINDLNKYERDFFVCAFSTSHINNKVPDEVYISGRNTQATSMNITVKAITGRGAHANQSATAVVFTEMTSRLVVQAGRNVSVVR